MKTIMKADLLLIEEGIKLLLDILEDLDEDEQLEFRKELEELLREIKLNPKRFVHFSLFGKKEKSYDSNKNSLNISNE